MTLSTPGQPALTYDVFVVHATADDPFVQGYLLAKLGLPPGRILRLQALELGEVVTEEIERGVRSSRVTIVVLSSAYMADRWAAFGQQLAAYAAVAKETHGVLLPLLLEDCKLPAHVESLVKLDFRDATREVWDEQIERLRTSLDRPVPPAPELPCPYPGMRPFTAGDAGRFFGREADVDRIVRGLVRGDREIYIIGASGSGKSSLIAAGLLPRLARGVDGLPRFRVKTLRPGERPLERLAAVLARDVTAPADALAESSSRPAAAPPMLLVIDQLEELFAIATDEQRRGFLAALRGLQADPSCVLVFALRADFYGSFMDSSLWTDRDGQISRTDLGPLRSDSLRVIIERPARELDVYFQPELVSRLLDDAAREPGALPLLQETLFQLWSKRRQRLLALADYRALSDDARTGLAFAVKEHADDVYRRLTSAQNTIAFRILLRLVNFGEGRADTRRQQPRDALRSEGELATDFDVVLQRLVNNRLLTVTGDDQHRDVRVDLAHEILIHAWTAFAEWIQTWRAHEQRRRELEAAAAAWRARGGKDGGLLDPVELAGARAWQDKAAPQLGHTAHLTAFLTASETAHGRAIRQRRRSRVAVWLALTASILVLVYAGSVLKQRNQRNRLVAESAQLYQYVGWQLLTDSERPLRALPYLVAAGEATETSGGTLSQSLRMLFAAATRNSPLSRPFTHPDRVLAAAFRPDDVAIVILGGGTARIWNAATDRSLTLPLQHQDVVQTAAFSSDGTRIVTSRTDNTARVWNATTGRPISPPLQHGGAVRSAAFSPDGAWIVTTSWDNTAIVWDAVTGKRVSRLLKPQAPVRSAAVSPDGTRLVMLCNDKTAQVWDVVAGRVTPMKLTHVGSVISAVFSPDGTRIVTASEDKTARIWNTATGKQVAQPLQHQGTVWSAAFSADGTRIVTASEDKTARIWDATTGTPLSPPLEHQASVRAAVFSFNGARVVTTSGDRITQEWDAVTDRSPSPSLPHPDAVLGAAFSPDGNRVITASGEQAPRVWNAFTGTPIQTALHPGVVRSIAFSPDRARVITIGADNTVCVWDAVTGASLSPPLLHQQEVLSAASSLDGRRVFTVTTENAVTAQAAVPGKPRSSMLQRGELVATAMIDLDDPSVGTVIMRVWGTDIVPPANDLLSTWQRQGDGLSAAYSFNGASVVITAGNSARVWDATTGEPRSATLEHRATVVSAAFSPDGTRIVTASADRTARVWDAGTGEALSPPLEHREAVRSAAFSPDGTRVVTVSLDKTARVWDASTGKPLSPPLEHRDAILSAAFSPDGTRVVTAGTDRTARVWDAITGEALSPPLEHQAAVRGAVFNSDGTRIVTISDDKTARIWNLPLASETLAEWRSIAERESPYVLANGVLSPRAAAGDRP